MNQEHEEHLGEILTEALERIDEKYRMGQAEHGGDLWRKKHLINFAIDEAVDQIVYLLTLKQQLKDLDVGEIDGDL